MDDGLGVNRVGRVARTISGVGFPLEEQGSSVGDLPFVKVSDLADPQNGRGIVTAANWVTASQATRLGVRVVPAGSVVFPKVGAALLGNARSIALAPCAIDNNLMAVAPRRGDPRYWYYALCTVDLADLNLSGTIPFVSDSAVRDLRLPVDRPTAEQRRIADFLDDQVARIDNIIAARRAQVALANEASRVEVIGILLAGGSLTGTASNAWYRDLPARLPIRPLRAAWQVVDCKHRTPTYVDSGFPVVSPGDLSPGALDLERCHRFVDETDYLDLADSVRRCRVGDIVYSRNASAGTAALVMNDSPFTMGQDVCRITSSRASQSYLFYTLNYAVAPQLESARVGSTFTRINIDEIKALRVPIPPDEDQRTMSAKVSNVLGQVDTITAKGGHQISLLNELKQSLITAAVTGDFDVSSADGSQVPVA